MPKKPPTHRPRGRPKRKSYDAEYNRRVRDPMLTEFYGSARWRKLRNWFLARHPICQECDRHGRTREATDVHHVLPVRSNMMHWSDPDNLMAVCRSCHNKLDAEARRGSA